MVIFWGENKLTLLYKLHTDYFSLCQSVSVVPWRDILKYLQKCEGCTHFCDSLYIVKDNYNRVDLWQLDAWHQSCSPRWADMIHMSVWLRKRPREDEIDYVTKRNAQWGLMLFKKQLLRRWQRSNLICYACSQVWAKITFQGIWLGDDS